MRSLNVGAWVYRKLNDCFSNGQGCIERGNNILLLFIVVSVLSLFLFSIDGLVAHSPAYSRDAGMLGMARRGKTVNVIWVTQDMRMWEHLQEIEKNHQ